MVRGKWLSEKETSAIDALLKIGINIPTIANNIKRSQTVVWNYVSKKKSRVMKKNGGRPPKLSQRAVRVVQHAARKGGKTARMVINETGVSASLRTVQRTLASSPFLECRVLKPRPMLNCNHIKRRFE